MASDTPGIIEWNKNYDVGFARFDQDHVELADLANRLIEAIHAGQSLDALSLECIALLGRTCRHFDDEESLMAETVYPRLPAHRADHNERVRDLVSFAMKCRQGTVDATQAGRFLLEWLVVHVLEEDVPTVPHFTSRGLK